MLQVINGSREVIEVFWLKSDSERVSNGRIQPGKDSVITTTLGHRFAIVGSDDAKEVIVTSVVPIQAIRFAPPDGGGVPPFYTRRVSASGFPIVGIAPWTIPPAAYQVAGK